MLFSYEDHVNGQLNTITSRCFFFLKETVFTVNCFIRLSEKFLLFYEGIIDVQRLLFYLFCRITYDPFCSVEINTVTFHVCMTMHCCKKHVRERKTLFAQPNTSPLSCF